METTAQTTESGIAHLGSTNSLGLWLRLMPFIRYLVDAVSLAGLLWLFVYLKTGTLQDSYQVAILLALMCHIFVYAFLNIYTSNTMQSLYRSLLQIVLGWFGVVGILLAFAFVTKVTGTFSREAFLQWIVVVPLVQFFVWLAIKSVSKSLAKSVSSINRCVVVGAGPHALGVCESLQKQLETENLVGLVSENEEQPLQVKTENIRTLGELGRLREIISGNRIRKVYIALESGNTQLVEKIQLDLLDLNVDVIWVPDMRSYNMVNHSIYSLNGNPAVAINQSPLTSPGPGPLYKSIMDKVVSATALLILSPLMIAVAVLIKLSSPGPVIFKQKRHGFDGEIIEIWKFRSMKLHEETNGDETQATKSDNRVTWLGQILRKTSIDELPQLINVLQGRMSLVGPRPHAVAHNDIYSRKIDAYLVRHRMKPGITGLAQISGYRGETDTLQKMEKRVEYDLSYINNWSLMLDIKILLKTPLALLKNEAY